MQRFFAPFTSFAPVDVHYKLPLATDKWASDKNQSITVICRYIGLNGLI